MKCAPLMRYKKMVIQYYEMFTAAAAVVLSIMCCLIFYGVIKV